MEAHIRFAIDTEKGFVGSFRGRDWAKGCSSYNINVRPETARLYQRQSDATKAAKATDGTVIPVLVVPLAETYTHPDGGTYRKLLEGAMKHPDTGVWFDAVTYQDLKTGAVYTTDLSRWRARFTKVA